MRVIRVHQNVGTVERRNGRTPERWNIRTVEHHNGATSQRWAVRTMERQNGGPSERWNVRTVDRQKITTVKCQKGGTSEWWNVPPPRLPPSPSLPPALPLASRPPASHLNRMAVPPVSQHSRRRRSFRGTNFFYADL